MPLADASPGRTSLPAAGASHRSGHAGLTSVVVVTHCSAATIEGCLRAVLSGSAPVEVVVVDNASDDITRTIVAELESAEPMLSVVLNDDNRGFAAACNQGAARAQGDALLFLNPDAFVATDTVRQLRTLLGASPSIGLLGCTVVDGRGRPQGPQRRREPTWRRSLSSLLGLARLEQRWPAFEGIEERAPLPAGSGPVVVDAVNGALMLVPRPVFERVGGFDEAFQLHAEDLDLCRRIRDAGCDVAMAPGVAVTHVGGVSSRRRRLQVDWWKTRSLWRYFRKHDADAGKPWIAALVAAGLALRFAVKLPLVVLRSLRK